MYSKNINEGKVLKMPGRDLKVLIGKGNDVINSEEFTVGLCQIPPKGKMEPKGPSTNEEFIYVLQGEGEVENLGYIEKLSPGTAVLLPIGSSPKYNNKSNELMEFIFAYSPSFKIGV